MPEEVISVEPTELHSDRAAGRPVCPVCGREAPDGLAPFAPLADELKKIISANVAAASLLSEICPRCIGLFERARVQLETDAAVFEQGGYVLSTPLRLDADDRFKGRGITIAFLDSGFYPHTDLTTPDNRILAYHSLVEAVGDKTTLETPDPSSWHGMMTSVVAAGNGGLSDGFYRGIAPESNVVLVKLARTGRISERDIERGIEWVLAHREEYGIRIVNISAGGDDEQSYLHNSLSQTIERAVGAGLIVVCAVGNAGHMPGHPVLPPASCPSVIAVGGLDDRNSLDRARRGMYRSSYGPTVDGLQKPEVIAPGIWVPAPILPHTPTAEEAELFAKLDAAPDDQLRALIVESAGVDKDLDEARDLPVPLLRQLITIKLREGNVITEHYKYVDGTSFAAPIVSSIIACMLEANPALTPQQVKRILIETAERLPSIEVDRQGWGVVAPRPAVELALALGPALVQA
ncbi:MAG TPA: S8 family serine peptidase [Pyrinomonadaceae bacterium]|jgi:serine protease AprX|nr:S8 family serine peptidase [Pyrinomonadaceae bacterium]